MVFILELLLLFSFCHFCKADHPIKKTWQAGSMIVIESSCRNSYCRKVDTWRSQPNMPGTQIPAGNLLLSFSILLTGGSPAKFLRALEHINLSAISLATFYRHQRVCTACVQILMLDQYVTILHDLIMFAWNNIFIFKEFLFPTVQMHWESYQKSLLAKLKERAEITISGDGRHDSMGHNAKFGAYTVYCNDTSQIVHFSLVQVRK